MNHPRSVKYKRGAQKPISYQFQFNEYTEIEVYGRQAR